MLACPGDVVSTNRTAVVAFGVLPGRMMVALRWWYTLLAMERSKFLSWENILGMCCSRSYAPGPGVTRPFGDIGCRVV